MLEVLTAGPSPRGGEAPLAERVQLAGAAMAPELAWVVDRGPGDGASVVARPRGASGTGVLLYSHLDTSLSGDETDRPVTGRTGPPGPLLWDPAGDRVEGFGLGVARGPCAAAVVGFVSAVRRLARHGSTEATLLLAGRGTHASPFAPPPVPSADGPAAPGPAGEAPTPVADIADTGVARFLATHDPPTAAVVAKGGPTGVLHEEPGAAFLRVRVRAPFTAVLARDHARPPGGLPAHLGVFVAAVEAWRRELVADASGQIAREAGIGRLSLGSPRKPDLLPGLLEAQVYITTLPGDTPDRLRTGLIYHLRRRVSGTPLDGLEVEVDAVEVHPACRTDPDAPVVRHAHAAWEAVHGAPPPEITRWPGSTDGAYLRARGIDTVRLGPAPRGVAEDPRRDVLAISDLVAAAATYAELVVRAAPPSAGQPATATSPGPAAADRS